MSISSSPNFRRFNALLESQTGNDYYTYTDICASMDIMRKDHLEAPDASAQSFIKVMGLRTIPSGDTAVDPDTIDRISNLNRYISALNAVAMGSEWRATDSGFITQSVGDKTYRVYVDAPEKANAIPLFVLKEAPGTLETDFKPRKSVPINQIISLLYKTERGVSCDHGEAFKQIGAGYDIGELLAEIEPDMQKEIEATRNAEPAGYLATTAMMNSINSAPSTSKPERKKSDSSLSM